MWLYKKTVLLIVNIFFIFHMSIEGQSLAQCDKKGLSFKEIRMRRVQAGKSKDRGIFDDFFKDIVYLNYNLFSFDSFKVIASVFPFYVAARMIDEPVQKNFYCEKHHKNINQMPWWCNSIARFGLALPFVGLSSLALFAHDEELRQTSWVFILGMPFLIFGNKVTKRFTFDGCERPWHEKFSCVKRSCGGFPSGHMAEVTYMAALYGSRFGYKWGIPLGVYGAFVGVNFLVSNRHYISQLVGGIGWGLMYTYAANRLIDSKMNKYNMRLSMTTDYRGAPAMRLACAF
ncbi:MAG: hypothetical protein M1114_03650 [Candidatus Dependentiae bacterium]|nr:hypothetical protein [Candidatus Dependentiae bacterium]